MSSISNPLQSVSTSLLNEIKSSSSSASSNQTAASNAASTSDESTLSPTASLFQQLQQLQSSNPTEFKQVLADGANKLEAAAAQSSDPTQAQFLRNLATKFEDASKSGNLSGLQPGSSSATGTSVSGHHHHHHGGGSAVEDPDDSTSSTSTSSSSSSTTSSSLLSYLQGSQSTSSTTNQDFLSSILNAQQTSSNGAQINNLVSSLVTSVS